MKLQFCKSIGFIPDFECDLECSIEWEHGEPVLVVDDVKVGGHSLFRSDDNLMVALAYRAADMAEDDDDLISEAVERDGITFHGLGPNDPDGYLEAAQ